jgi:hypothetical protein
MFLDLGEVGLVEGVFGLSLLLGFKFPALVLVFQHAEFAQEIDELLLLHEAGPRNLRAEFFNQLLQLAVHLLEGQVVRVLVCL